MVLKYCYLQKKHMYGILDFPCDGFAFLAEDGVWMTWSVWGDCSVTCGGGLQYRNRSCDGPRYGGAECEGAVQEQRNCGENPCPSKIITSSFT